MGSIDITWVNLALGSIIFLVPIAVLHYYKTGLVRSLLLAFLRMCIQLFLIGYYLGYIFDLNSIWVNILWVVVMVIAASFTIVKRSELNFRYFLMPVLIGVVTAMLFDMLIFLGVLIGPEEFFIARYIIPIAGMIIGNCLSSSIIGLRTFYKSLDSEKEHYHYKLMCGASKAEALFSYISEALKSAFGPMVASIATIGLIWLPGMMTGQILGGSDPMTAIKYQILILVAILSGGVLTVFISIFLSKKIAFDEYDLMKESIVKMNND